MADIFKVSDQTFQEEVLNSDTSVLVDFWAPWCGPCRMVAPVLEQLAGEWNGKIRIAKLNVDENPAIATEYGVMSIPTLILFKDGAEAHRMIGFRPKDRLKQELESKI